MIPGEPRAIAPVAEIGCGCGCGTPPRASFPLTRLRPDLASGAAQDRHRIDQARIPRGGFAMGDASGGANPGDGETPVHEVRIGAFEIDVTSVTNADFARFVTTTGYQTDAELFGSSAVFHLDVDADTRDVLGVSPAAPWWQEVRGASWAHPGGPRTDVEALMDHPVVHVSWNDAMAYCAWSQRSLPTEAEWEYASRGGLPSAKYPWGDAEVSDDGWRANIWQGEFPRRNTADDGWLSTAPVRSYAPNAWGLWQTVGNVWEWCADWFDPEYYGVSSREDPQGPRHGHSKVLRGGSFLCHRSYCNRYRNSARSRNTPDSSMSNAGFRTVARPAPERALTRSDE